MVSFNTAKNALDAGVRLRKEGDEKGAEESFKLAAQGFRASAERGDTNGLQFMGYICRRGMGVPKSQDEALRWYNMALTAAGPEPHRCKMRIRILQKLRDIYMETGKVSKGLEYNTMLIDEGDIWAMYDMGRYCLKQLGDLKAADARQWFACVYHASADNPSAKESARKRLVRNWPMQYASLKRP